MNQEYILKLEKSIENLRDKNSRIYFLVQDTKNNPKASVSYIYKMAYTLLKNGFNARILHEYSTYSLGDWLNPEYNDIPHHSLENTNLEISPEDFLVLPELYGFVMAQVTKLPCGKIILCQSHDYILETLKPGESWTDLGFFKCITTSEMMKEHILNVMRNVSVDIISPTIPDTFKSNNLPAKPIIAIHSRDQRDGLNLIKTFYLKFPQYRWFTFRDMRGLSEKEFATTLQDCCLAVWIDEISSYGTFPLEAMKSNVPVLGLVPNLVPQWMSEDNGLWVNNKIQMADFVADFIQNWMEDNLNENLFSTMKTTVETLPTHEKFESEVLSNFESYINKRLVSFEEQLNKFQTIEQ
jgi:hypothetical protein